MSNQERHLTNDMGPWNPEWTGKLGSMTYGKLLSPIFICGLYCPHASSCLLSVRVRLVLGLGLGLKEDSAGYFWSCIFVFFIAH